MAKRDDEATLTTDDKFELLIAALTAKQDGGLSKDDLRTILSETAAVSASSMKQALKPENETHPGISCFSYPEGDVKRPKPALPCEFFWNNYPIHKFTETQHWRELELMTKVTPGEYTVLRKDGSRMSVTVKGDKDADGKLTRLSVEFPVSRDEKWLVPPMMVLLYQLVFNDHPRKRFVEAMQEHLAMVMGQENESVAV